LNGSWEKVEEGEEERRRRGGRVGEGEKKRGKGMKRGREV